jgi:hypothetical protein
MYPGGICPEKDRLLRKLSAAVDEHAIAADEVVAMAGIEHVSFVRAKERAQQMRRAVQTAKSDYRQHTREHGC